jgi:hypothetical protein
MKYDLLFAGLAGTLIGVWFTCRLTYGFQKSLLKQQLDFQKQLLEQQLAFEKQQGEADAVLRRQIHDEMISTLTEFRNMLNTRYGQMVSRLPS